MIFLDISAKQCYNITKGGARSVQMRQFSENPNPIKQNKQSVHSLGAEAAR